MNFSSEVIGHQNQLNFLTSCYQNKFPHSWIFYGSKGIGKYKTIKGFKKKYMQMKRIIIKKYLK